MKLEQLGLDQRTFRALQTQGLNQVDQVLARDPADFVRQKRVWTELSQALLKAAAARPEIDVQIQEFLARGQALREGHEVAREQERANDPDRALPEDERALVKVLRGHRGPVPLRSLRREAQLSRRSVKVRHLVTGSQTMLVYPFGVHSWVGLKEWGLEGYLQAARGAWSILPQHLTRLLSEGREGELEAPAWEALTQVAIEHGDDEMVLLCQQKPEPVQPEKLPEPVKEEIRQVLERVGPRLFEGLDSCDWRGAMARVVKLSQNLTKPFSLAQLCPTSGDLGWLKAWARQVSATQVQGWLGGTDRLETIAQQKWSGSECLGVLLLLLASEEARRRGSEGQVWYLLPGCFEPGARDELFTGGQPRAATRESIEAGARRLGVHHAFGREGRQSWYLTIFLQFGFTRQKISQLPLWLTRSESISQACQQLLAESSEFGKLWRALKEYRKANLERDEMRQVLEASPFVLDAWVGEILSAARRDVDIEMVEAESGELPLMSTPALQWAYPEAPEWVLTCYDLQQQGLLDSGYELQVDGQDCGRIVRRGDGSWLVEPAEIRGRLEQAELEIEWLSDLGEDDRESRVALWDQEDIVAFEAVSGERRRGELSLSTRKSYVLVLLEGLKLSCQTPTKRVGNRVLHYLEAGWEQETEVLDEQGRAVLRLAGEAAPAWLDSTWLHYDGPEVKLDKKVALRLGGLPPEAKLEWARYGSEELPMSATMGGYEVKVRLPASLASPSVAVRFCVTHQGRRHRFSRSAALRLFDASICFDSGWQRFDRLGRLEAESVQQARCRFFLPSEARDWAILEGASFAERPRARVFRLGRPSGFGAGLTLVRGPYNSTETERHLADSIIDQGRASDFWIENDQWSLKLTRSLEADEGHRVVLWSSADEYVTIDPDGMAWAEGKLWKGSAPYGFEPAVGGLAFEGAHLGAAWETEFEPPWASGRPRRAAGLMRWLHLPLLDSRWLERASRFAQTHPVECLQAWLIDRRVDEAAELGLRDESDDWFGVVRHLFKGWSPASEVAREVWDGLFESVANPSLVLSRLLQADPILTLKVVTRAKGFGKGEYGQLRKLAALGLEVDELARLAGEDMGVDAFFARRLCELVADNKVDDKARRNLELACQVGSFARLLTVIYLDRKCLKGAV